MAHFPPLAPPVNVSGATGPNAANINGVYRPVEGEGVEQAGVRVMRHAAAVQVSGATGPHAAIINGVYRPVAGEVVGGKPVYKKDGADNWIEYWPGTMAPLTVEQWQVKPASSKGTEY